MDDKRLNEVEIRYTYLEQLVRDLSEVIRDQQQTITAFSSRLERVEQVIGEALQQPGDRLPHEKPPHY